MKWLEVTVYTTDAGIEPVCAALNGAGIDGLSIEESHEAAGAFLKEAAVFWDFADMDKIGTDTPCVKAYLPDLPESLPRLKEAEASIARLKGMELGVDMGTLECVRHTLDEEDWANVWKQYYKPLAIGKRLWVVPSWERAEAPKGRETLVLDPGMAFGTGTHHTTRLCLEFLEQSLQTGDAVLDLGCGSGILSIAALLLGAKSVTAVDIDPAATKITRENALLNGLSPALLPVETGNVLSDEGLCRRIAGSYDLVLANIVANVIIPLAPFAKKLVRPGGVFLCSGIIEPRAAETERALLDAGFVLEEKRASEDWLAYRARG